MLIYVCHFHHHFLLRVTFPQFRTLSRYSCLHLGSLHPRILTTKLCWKESYIPAKDGFSSLGNTFSIFWKKSWVTTTMSQLLTKARMGYLTSIGVLLRAGCFDWKYSWSEQIKSSWHIIPILFQTGNDTKPKVIITFYRRRNLRLNF